MKATEGNHETGIHVFVEVSTTCPERISCKFLQTTKLRRFESMRIFVVYFTLRSAVVTLVLILYKLQQLFSYAASRGNIFFNFGIRRMGL